MQTVGPPQIITDVRQIFGFKCPLTHRPSQLAARFHVRQVHAQIKLVLVVLGLHVGAELVEVFVVLFFLDVGQLVHGDHAQKLVGHFFEQGRHADFAFGF